jgi:5-methyltetrahydrofolate--homocysteine methyltransferase
MPASSQPAPVHASIRELLAHGPVLTDGAWGTQLQARGLPTGAFPDAWNLSHPDEIIAIGRAYVDAGSRVILTNTFGANRLRLAESDLAQQIPDINRLGVALSRQATQDRARVFASIGPTGKLLVAGETNPEELRAAFEEQAHALATAQPDAIVVETMTDLDEACIAVSAARATQLPVVACMVFDSGPQHDRTMMGVTPEQAALALTQAGADVLGANCGQDIHSFLPVCQRLIEASHRPVWLKPNAGIPQLVEGQPLYQTQPADFARHALQLLKAGASFIGGCCGTRPDFIRAIQKLLP